MGHYERGELHFSGENMKKTSLTALAVLMASTALTILPQNTEAALKGNLGFIRPMTDWRIGEISTEGNGYCASVNKFEQGFTMALAKAQNGNFSFAIDFPDSRFKPGQTLPVTLQHSDGYSLQSLGRAVNSRSLIIQLGKEDLMFSAIAGEGHLNVSLPDVDMKVSLVTFAKSAQKLNDCVDSLSVEPIEIQEVRAIPPQVPGEVSETDKAVVTATLLPMPEHKTVKTSSVSKVEIQNIPAVPMSKPLSITQPIMATADQLETLTPMAGQMVESDNSTRVMAETEIVKQKSVTVESTSDADLDSLRRQRLQAINDVSVSDAVVTSSEMTVQIPQIAKADVAPAVDAAPEMDVKTAETIEIKSPVTSEVQGDIMAQLKDLEKSNKELAAAKKSLELSGLDTPEIQKTKALLTAKIDSQTAEMVNLNAQMRGEAPVQKVERKIVAPAAEMAVVAPKKPVVKPVIMPAAPVTNVVQSSVETQTVTKATVAEALDMEPQVDTVIEPVATIDANADADLNIESNVAADVLMEKYEPQAGGAVAAVGAYVPESRDEMIDRLVSKHDPSHLTVKKAVALNSMPQKITPSNSVSVVDGLNSVGFSNVSYNTPKIMKGKGSQQIWAATFNGLPVKGSVSTYEKLSSENFKSHASGFLKAFAQSQCDAINDTVQMKSIGDQLAATNISCKTKSGVKNVSMIFYVDANDRFTVMHHEEANFTDVLVEDINGTLIQHISSAMNNVNSNQVDDFNGIFNAPDSDSTL